MPAFDYSAVDVSGRTVAGVLTAADEAAAKTALARRRLMPLSLSRTSGAAAATEKTPRRSRKLSSRTLALTTRQLATLITVAPVDEALRTLMLQAERPDVRAVLSGVHAGVVEGQRLSEAMARQGAAFPPLYRATVAAGEASGALGPILERLAEGLERDQVVRGKVITALVYPAVLALVALGVVTALMIFVVPKVVDQFDSMNQTLPLLTRAVIGVSDLMRHWGWLIALLLAGGIGGFVVGMRSPAFRLAVDRRLLRLPVVGRLTRDLHGARMARTLSTMIAAGLPVLEGLTITARTVSNRALRASTEMMADAVREGGGLSAAMRRADVFPPILVHMTASGEASGRLEPMMERAADYLEREFSAFTAVMLSFLEPAIIVVMGGVVALIVLSILLPILQINTLAMG
ncbi:MULTISPECIES: type II secretion system inner membrane protein GspF [unclassified Brevundimonas]|uniref:type II secretion system inner membrane protein GspF n=1 Tax=unclassified Brevundimonas TaxID=2622653 RepID=UPI000CFE0A59|nr:MULTISPECIES: type II secretion system inner membrane protein GspF [unclassified Brevundimonas]PRA28171.1 type II secretion system protein GspF [Brevundimonas sp. MYb27]PQZ79643.1 type II secretion system protein GspF [Brevundimonas sp. MYb31]PRB15379.1 type II secretion system protein GspF [Brevundimonas sp. MYb52]PRB35698.1 type II secretion system protein GspF [Brevundimonas sp. MYb46]PRB46337.1 type II secretion system protein GspF [Brevundimonas sp. MYb33]